MSIALIDTVVVVAPAEEDASLSAESRVYTNWDFISSHRNKSSDR